MPSLTESQTAVSHKLEDFGSFHARNSLCGGFELLKRVRQWVCLMCLSCSVIVPTFVVFVDIKGEIKGPVC